MKFSDLISFFLSRLVASLSLIRFSLLPVITPDLPPAHNYLPGSWHTVPPETLYGCFRTPSPLAAGEFIFFVAGVFPLTAVFVLFRLKRWGFSGCRVVAERGGLLIRARR